MGKKATRNGLDAADDPTAEFDEGALSVDADEDDSWRKDIVYEIFGDVGAIRQDYSCAIERQILLHGRLYITDDFLCFYTNIFGFEEKIRIPFSHITCITKENTAVFIPNAIAIITHRKEYIFRSFWDRDECYDILKARIDELRRELQPTSRTGTSAQRPVDVSSSSVPKQDPARRRDETAPPPPPPPSPPPPPPPPPSSRALRIKSATTAADGDMGETARKNEAAGSLPPSPTAFLSATRSAPLAHHLRTAVLDVPITGFFDAFLRAECSLVQFHESQGDFEVSATTWAAVATSESTRELRFRRALDSPIGPSSTRTTKTQHCRRFADEGAVINTVLSMEDIPYRDCFTIADRWVIEQTAQGDDLTPLFAMMIMLFTGTKTRIRFEHECVFTKSTIWQGRIEASSKTDLAAFYTAYVAYAERYLEMRHAALRRESSSSSSGAANAKAAAALGDLEGIAAALEVRRRQRARRKLTGALLWTLALVLGWVVLRQNQALQQCGATDLEILDDLRALHALVAT